MSNSSTKRITHCFEAWVILGDITNSTEYFSELNKIMTANPTAFFKTTTGFAVRVSSLFDFVEKSIRRTPGAQLVNTMGDAFLVRGVEGHGTDHISREATNVIGLAQKLKSKGDRQLTKLKKDTLAYCQQNGVSEPTLPDLKLKIVINQGYLVREAKKSWYFGDTINYASRVATSAFQTSECSECFERIVLTDRFVKCILERRPELTVTGQPRKIDVKNYPRKERVLKSTVFYLPQKPIPAVRKSGH